MTENCRFPALLSGNERRTGRVHKSHNGHVARFAVDGSWTDQHNIGARCYAVAQVIYDPFKVISVAS
jgi:hypothetical protein